MVQDIIPNTANKKVWKVKLEKVNNVEILLLPKSAIILSTEYLQGEGTVIWLIFDEKDMNVKEERKIFRAYTGRTFTIPVKSHIGTNVIADKGTPKEEGCGFTYIIEHVFEVI
jgi:hypothetical protein